MPQPLLKVLTAEERTALEDNYHNDIHEANKQVLTIDFLTGETVAYNDKANPRKTWAAHEKIKGKLEILNELINCI